MPADKREDNRDPGATGDAVLLTRKRVFILPTAAGFAFGAALLVMMVGAVNYNNSLGYLMVFLLASVALVSILHTYRNLKGLRLRPGRGSPAFAGERARFRVCLENPDAGRRHALSVGYDAPGAGTRRAARTAVGTSVPRLGVQCVELPVQTLRRGWLRLERVIVATRYPLGLFRAWSPVTLDLACLVYPRPAGDRPLPLDGGGHDGQGRPRGAGQEDFGGFREFRRGDSPRRVYWKGVARGQAMMVTVFTGAAREELVLRWEEAGAGDVEARLSQLCRWVLEAHRAGLRFGLRLPGRVLSSDHGEPHLHRCLAALALYGEGGG